MNIPKISVIVPVYQAEKYLEECITSILGQTFSDFELLLIDDGSKDGSGGICDAYAAKDERITVIHKANEGVSAARNTGLEICRGEYIAFVDADDTIDSGFLACAIEAMTERQIDLFISGLYMETWKKGMITESIQYGIGISCNYSVQKLLENLEERYPQICICGSCCKLYKRSMIQDHRLRFPEYLNYGEDTWFNLDYLAHCRWVYFSQECFYHYRRENAESLFSRFHEDTYEIHHQVYSEMRMLMQLLKCSETAMVRFEVLYFSMLLGGIHEYYRFYGKTTAKERLHQIEKVAQDSHIAKVRMWQIPAWKNRILFILLRFRLYRVIAFAFEWKYHFMAAR